MPERSKRKSVGPVSAVPCPWCKRSNDLSDTVEMNLLTKGMRFKCDECGQHVVVVAVQTAPHIVVAQYHGEIPPDDVVAFEGSKQPS